MKALHSAKYSRFSKHGERKTGQHGRRLLSMLLCLCMVVSMMFNFGGMVLSSAVAQSTQYVLNRIADNNTMDSYIGKLLSSEWGSRYAGRVWTDKSVFAFDAEGDNSILLDMLTDGYDIDGVGFNADFAHVFSALASSQVINEPSPMDVMFVIDVSGSMGQILKDDKKQVVSKDEFGSAPISQLVTSVNTAINQLLEASPDSRIGIAIYGSTAAVLVPLGHYERSDHVLSTEYKDIYGGSQGLHFELNATVTRVGEEKSVTYYSDNAGLTSNAAHSASGDGNRTYEGTGGQTTGDGQSKETAYHVGHITNPQAGLAAAMDQFITHDERTWVNTAGDEYLRIPSVIHLTDGQASDLAWIQPTEDSTSGYGWTQKISNWNNVNWEYDLAYNSQNKSGNANIWNASQLTGAGNAAPVIFQTLMTAAYYKSAVEAFYASSGFTDVAGNAVSLSCYSIYASDTTTYESIDDNQIKATIDATLNPAQYFKDAVNDSIEIDSSSLDSKKDPSEKFIDAAYELYKLWLQNGKVEQTFNTATTSAGKGKNDIDIKISVGDVKTNRAYDEDWNNITKTTIRNNIDYVKEGNFHDVSFGELTNLFDTIIDELMGAAFIPLSGDNGEGVGDSITYQDPLGEYMEIKNESITATPHHIGDPDVGADGAQTYDMALLLFGEMHGLVRAGVYDYHWNDEWMDKWYPEDNGETAFQQGWYKGTAEEAANAPLDSKYLHIDDSGSWPEKDPDTDKTYESAEDARNDGWVMRFNFETLLSFVPITGVDTSKGDVSPDGLPEQVKNTVYTCYRFAGSQADRNKLRRNPIYGAVPADVQTKWDQAYDKEKNQYPVDDSIYSKTPGVYRLSDIRVWVEDTGDFTDVTGAITPNTGYDRSLYVNIPVAALPTQLATVTLGPDGVTAYQTNLGSDHPKGSQIMEKNEEGEDVAVEVTEEKYENFCYQSTPFRLFYAVGLEDDLILRDAAGNQVGVDLNSVSPEYIQAHTAENGNVWFISNYYSGTRYGDYATDSTSRTRGDPTVTFSPGIDNRYYLFQKALPLYAHAYRVKDGGTGGPVDFKTADGENFTWDKAAEGTSNGTTTWEDGNKGGASWAGGRFMGVYRTRDAFLEAYKNMETTEDGVQYITDSHGSVYEFVNDGVIFSEEDLLDHVTSTEDGGVAEGSHSFSSDDYYFILLEFYVPIPNTTGKDQDGKDIAGSSASKFVQYALARKGSEFGSGYVSGSIQNGDMLCWTFMDGGIDTNFAYMSASDTGDLTRGEPTWEKLTYKNDETDQALRTYLMSIGIDEKTMIPNPEYVDAEKTPDIPEQINLLEQQVDYWLAKQADPQVQAALKAAEAKATENGEDLSKDNFNTYLQFAVAARPGGIRSGDMSNNLQYKGGSYNTDTGYYEGNCTGTSNTYYLPTISDKSGTDNNVIINNFLGNNGRLEIANETLHVTKTLVPPEGFRLTDKQKSDEVFNYQVSIQGVTGTRTAVKTEYNEYAETWERELGYIDVLTDNSDLVQTNNSTRALFVLEETDSTLDGGTKIPLARQVILGEDGTTYYYADDSGSISETPAKTNEDGSLDLYYLYLPSNGTGENTHVHRLYQNEDYEGADKDDFKDGTVKNGTTTFVDKDHEDMVTPSEKGNTDSYRLEDKDKGRPAGTKTYWVQNAELISKEEVEAAEANDILMGSPDEPGGISTIAAEVVVPGAWTHDEANHKNHQSLTFHTFVIRKPNAAADDSTTIFTSPYKTRTQYLTVTLTFGQNANENDGSTNPTGPLTAADLYDSRSFGTVSDINRLLQITAEFTLKHNEGLMFSGLSGSQYRFTEKLTDAQKSVGYTLKDVVHVEQLDTTTHHASEFADKGGVYSVNGDTGDGEEQVHYTNTIDPELFVLTKALVDASGNEIPTSSDVEFTFHVTFTPSGDEAMTDKDMTLHIWRGNKDMTGGKTWKDKDGVEHQMPTNAPSLEDYQKYLDTTKEPLLETIEPDKDGDTNTYTVKVKPREAVVFYGLIAGTNFSVEEEADPDYPMYPLGSESNTIKGKVARVSEDPDAIDPAKTTNRAEFKNLMRTGALTVEKEIHDDDKWEVDKTFTFTVTLTAADGKSLDKERLDVTKIKKAKDDTESSEDITKSVAWTETTAADGSVTELTADITLKHGERFVISGIPMGTKYTVKETGRDGYNLEYVVDRINGDPTDSNDFIHPKDFSTDGEITEDQPQANWLFVNAKPPILPFSGGGGIGLFYLLGAALIISGVVFMIFCGKRRVRVK